MKAFRNIIVEKITTRKLASGVEVPEDRSIGKVISSDVDGINVGDTIYISSSRQVGDYFSVKPEEVEAIDD